MNPNAHNIKSEAEEIATQILNTCGINITDVITRDIVYNQVCNAIDHGIKIEAREVGRLINLGGPAFEILGESIFNRGYVKSNRE